jgi:hypothetical protein
MSKADEQGVDIWTSSMRGKQIRKESVGALDRMTRDGCCATPTTVVVDMASVLLRRRLAHNISFAQRRLLSSTSSVLAQAAPQANTRSGQDAFNRHIAEGLQGVSASEILAETGTRKDAQMRHFTSEDMAFLSPLLA